MGFCSLTAYTHVRAGPAWNRAASPARSGGTAFTEPLLCADIVAVGTLLVYAGPGSVGGTGI